jgi:hypothetical protein
VSFNRLLATDRGKIVLVNLHQTVQAELIEGDLCAEILRLLAGAFERLPDAYSAGDIERVISEIVWSDERYQLAAQETLDEGVHIAAVKPYDDLLPLLQRIRKLRISARLDEEIRSAIAEFAPEQALRRGIEILNERAPEAPQLTIGRGFNIFWATTLEAVRATAAQERSAPHVLRDRLGLVHFDPAKWKRGLHLIVFEATLPIGQLPTAAFRAARPTTLDGFDNPRFRQYRPPDMAPRGYGATVDITDGDYALGLPEIVSTEIPIQANFTCRYLGRVIEGPRGTDEGFVDFLSQGADLQAMARTLDAAARM